MRVVSRILGAAFLASALGCMSASKDAKLPPEKEGVRESIRGHLGEVSDCYTAALKKNPKLNGKLVLEWEVNPIGDPRNVTVIQSVHPKLDQCIAKKLSGWAFPPPPDEKVMRVRYPFVFTKPDETVATAPAAPSTPTPAPESTVTVTGMKKCPQVEVEYAQACARDVKTGECALDDRKFLEVLRLIQDSPRLTLGYLAELDRLLKNQKPSEPEVVAIAAKLNEDCWTSIHSRMWDSVFFNLKGKPDHPQKPTAFAVLKERATVEVADPTLRGLKLDIAILQKAMDAGLISSKASSKKDLSSLKDTAEKLHKSLAKEWTGGKSSLKEGDAFPVTSTESSKMVLLVRKELKSVKPLRARFKDWTRKI